MERDYLRNCTPSDFDSASALKKLNSIHFALRAALNSYISNIDEGFLYKIPYYSYFFSSPKINLKQAVINFRDNRLVTIYRELQAEIIPVKSAGSM